jgi:uncharacterized membrane protein
VKRVLVPLAIYAAILGALVAFGWIVGSWYIALGAILIVTLLTQLVWRNWWGDRYLLDRDARGR